MDRKSFRTSFTIGTDHLVIIGFPENKKQHFVYCTVEIFFLNVTVNNSNNIISNATSSLYAITNFITLLQDIMMHRYRRIYVYIEVKTIVCEVKGINKL